ncbi:MAG: hypothetical protein M0R30_09945 [Methanoregula sp.]|uniref:hypothetical protein n=1 Tax=Methanoregula sp. TaxID=2052170 RepID=UPI0025E1DE55|nr:hypothetical protein [Methanoregula sp.]MCK9631952.1 hypothetical protein [Methanoregula sp.]
MGTGLRGYGWYKWDLLMEVYYAFEATEFTYAAAAMLPGFDRKTYMSLYYDGLILKKAQGLPSKWKLSDAAISSIIGSNLPDDAELESEITLQAPRRSKRALLHSEAFVQQILEAVDFFSKPEVIS